MKGTWGWFRYLGLNMNETTLATLPAGYDVY
ncbi:hypothetical protein WG66_000848 [Moniliophthora roreri]|nr:hypothetical protein WG66_000848 [Moniliophthora roreri]